VLEHEAGTVTAANILDAMGNGETIGMIDVTDLRGFRVQLLAGEIVCEVQDGGTWVQIGVLDEMPAWTSGSVDLGFGMSDPLGGTTVFDDFNLDPPR
jgi:hypothetical protein